MIGTQISHYRVLSEVGRGGMGIVYRARDLRLDRDVALKVLAPDLMRDPEVRGRFVREARTAAALSHPGITVVHEIDEADGVAFIAMEMVAGQSLAVLLANETPSLQRVIDLAAQVAEGLAEGHAHGVVHRDLKPSNVMVTNAGMVKIIDFGLAKPARPVRRVDPEADTPPRGYETPSPSFGLPALSPTDAGRILGTAEYMSPEQVRGQSVDARSDVFSFGTLLLEALSGHRAFRRATAIETMNAILKESPPPLPPLAGPAVQAELQRMVDKCLQKVAALRYPSALDLAVDLRALLRRLEAGLDAPTSRAYREGPAPREDRPLRCIIVDDEDLARDVLREFVTQARDVEIVAECRNGFEAVKAVTELRPDLLFLDIQMPKLDGFEVLELIGGEIAVVFVTAFDEHAIRAFEVHAVDYLLKPVSSERVATALARARQRIVAGTPTPVDALVEAARPDSRLLERVLVRDGAKVHVFPVEDIDFVQAQDDYIALNVHGKEYLKQQPLGELERSVDPSRFVRIHRSYLLNVDRLAKIESDSKDSRIAVLRDGTRLPVSRSGYSRLRALL
jgi:two-component system LytT family response regulator